MISFSSLDAFWFEFLLTFIGSLMAITPGNTILLSASWATSVAAGLLLVGKMLKQSLVGAFLERPYGVSGIIL